MKRTVYIGCFIATLAFGAIVTTHVFGDDQNLAGPHQMAMNKGGDPSKSDQPRLDMLKEKLGLSDDQVAKLKEVFKNQRESTKPIREKMRADMQELQNKRKAKASDADLKTTLDALAADRQDMQVARQKLQDQIREILTPEQQAKFVLDKKENVKQSFQKWNSQKDGKQQ